MNEPWDSEYSYSDIYTAVNAMY
eukprot:SAG22_NODE_22798_length_187_cov_122.261364_1_plen_22_part_10